MNEIQIQAQLNELVSQRNNALNQVVNLAGALAVAENTIKELTAKVEAAEALVSEAASDSEFAQLGDQ